MFNKVEYTLLNDLSCLPIKCNKVIVNLFCAVCLSLFFQKSEIVHIQWRTTKILSRINHVHTPMIKISLCVLQIGAVGKLFDFHLLITFHA